MVSRITEGTFQIMPGADDRQQQSRESSLSREGPIEERAPNAFDSSSVIDITINRRPIDAYFNYNEESSLQRVRDSLSNEPFVSYETVRRL